MGRVLGLSISLTLALFVALSRPILSPWWNYGATPTEAAGTRAES
jgi:hypothetical protein